MEETAWIGKFDFELGLASTLSFRFGEAWQRFCNTSCRLEYHGKKHGKPYLPKKLYQARRREAGKGVVGLFG